MVFFFTKFCVSIVIMIMLLTSKQLEAMRPLEGEEWLLKKNDLVIQSLQRGPVPRPGSSCTFTPGGGNSGRPCPINGRKVAGHVVAQAPPVFPGAIVEFGVAEAMRPLEGEELSLKKNDLVVIQSLQKGPVPRPGSSCTYTQGGGNPGRCPPLNGRKVAGHHVVAQAPSVFLVPFMSNSV